MKIVPSGRSLAVVNALVGALMVYGGALEAVSYWSLRPAYVIAGLLGAAVGAAFFASGVVLWRRQSYARAFTTISCAAVIVVHAVSWRMGLLGVPAIVLTIIYPTLVLLSLWRNRTTASSASPWHLARTDDHRNEGSLKRVAVPTTL